MVFRKGLWLIVQDLLVTLGKPSLNKTKTWGWQNWGGRVRAEAGVTNFNFFFKTCKIYKYETRSTPWVLLPSLSSRKHIIETQPYTSLVTEHTKTTQNITLDSHSCTLQPLPSQPRRRNTQKYNIDTKHTFQSYLKHFTWIFFTERQLILAKPQKLLN